MILILYFVLSKRSKKMPNGSWYFLYHHDPIDKWSLPIGFAEELEKQNIDLKTHNIFNLNKFKLPSREEIIADKISVLLIFFCGYSNLLIDELIKFKKVNPEVIIINELADEPQTRRLNYVRAALSDICLSPDYESVLYWKSRNFNCHWFTHWADSKVFKNCKNERPLFLATTMGRRKYSLFLKLILFKKFENKRVESFENTEFYNKSKNAFQYARWNEITRRVFEASACGCCVITNELPKSTRIQEIFSHGESIIFFKNRISLVFELMKLYLNPRKSERIGKTAQFIVEKNHTEIIRVRQLISLVLKYKSENN